MIKQFPGAGKLFYKGPESKYFRSSFGSSSFWIISGTTTQLCHRQVEVVTQTCTWWAPWWFHSTSSTKADHGPGVGQVWAAAPGSPTSTISSVLWAQQEHLHFSSEETRHVRDSHLSTSHGKWTESRVRPAITKADACSPPRPSLIHIPHAALQHDFRRYVYKYFKSSIYFNRHEKHITRKLNIRFY